MSIVARHKQILLGILLSGVLICSASFAVAADLDGDGVSDIDEVTEYGTDPFLADIADIVAEARVTVASLPSDFTLEGERLLLTGYAPRQAGAIEFRLEKAKETLSVQRLYPDERGVFSGLWDLAEVCRTAGAGDYRIVAQDREMHRVHMSCAQGRVLQNMMFAGAALSWRDPITLRSASEAVFEARGPVGVRLYAVYASVTFAKDLYAEGEGPIRVAPWKPLEPGEHTLIVMPHDPIRGIVYEPVMVPFSIVEPLSEQLKSTVYYAPGGLLIIGIVFAGSILYIRRQRFLRRGIMLDGEEYPDDLY